MQEKTMSSSGICPDWSPVEEMKSAKSWAHVNHDPIIARSSSCSSDDLDRWGSDIKCLCLLAVGGQLEATEADVGGSS